MKIKKPKLLVFVRHGESEANFYLNEIAQGKLMSFPRAFLDLNDWDIKLTEKGKKQAYLTGKNLKKEFGVFDYIYISPQKRAQETYQEIIKAYPKNLRKKIENNTIIDTRLREKDYGSISYLTEEEIRKFFPQEYERKKKEGEFLYRPLGGESWIDVKDLRVSSFLNMIYNEHFNKKILVISHFIVINCVKLKLILDYQNNFEEILKEEPLKNCGVCVFKNFKNKLILKYWNKIYY